MGNNVAINKETASVTMGEILSETEGLLTELEDGYTALAGSIANSKGEYIDALKVLSLMNRKWQNSSWRIQI